MEIKYVPLCFFRLVFSAAGKFRNGEGTPSRYHRPNHKQEKHVKLIGTSNNQLKTPDNIFCSFLLSSYSDGYSA